MKKKPYVTVIKGLRSTIFVVKKAWFVRLGVNHSRYLILDSVWYYKKGEAVKAAKRIAKILNIEYRESK